MKRLLFKILLPLIAILVLLSGCHSQKKEGITPAQTYEETKAEFTVAEAEAETIQAESENKSGVVEDGHYTSKEEVAEYIHKFGKLPGNYITKTKAKKLGWNQNEGNLQEVLPEMSIGGSPFGNNEGLLPEAPGRQYYECDIDYKGGHRNAKRIVYSNDGLIFYTEDHYESFEQLY